ncbi:MAG: hypothetical protein LBU72_08160 [Burkholderiaceae bacterium]|nr:hypothetical protein [Burkholderiaceae bacterium]
MIFQWFSGRAPRFRAAARMALWHLCVSVVIALAAGVLVFGLWYPYPYRNLSGGLHLFTTLIVVDMVCGPLLMFVLFNPAKRWRERAVDFSLIGLIQLGALIYGLHVVAQARPVVTAFEADRLTVVSAEQINPAKLREAQPQFRHESWTGPRLLGTREAKPDEQLASIAESLGGVEPSARPGWWQPYDESLPAIRKRMQKAVDLRARLTPEKQAALDAAVRQTGLPLADLYYLPLVSARQLDSWIALLDAQGKVVGYAPEDGFPPDKAKAPTPSK